MSERISAELAATCGALGFYDGVSYHLDKHCIDVIKDLIKYLKRDDDSHTVRQYLGQAKLLETDLKKIFVQHYDKSELWDVLLRLLINLTSPALLVYNEELPSEKTTRNMYEQLVVHLQRYKVALADDRVWSIVGKRLQTILNMDHTERGEENELVIERILTLIRNVLQVPANDNETRADSDASLHDEVLFALHTSGLVDMLLFIASNDAEQQYHMQVLEIIALMLSEQCPKTLATAGLERNALEKEKDVAKLLAIREKETREKMDKMKKYAGSRHSRFGGTFVVQNMKAIGDNQLICHKPYQKIEALEFGQDKVKVKKPKKKTPVTSSEKARTSALSVRLFLKEFCVEFLNGAYNPVMSHARSCINGRNHGIASDASYYLWTLRFFMEFNRHYKFQVKYVSETISTEIFYLVQRQLEQYYEMMIANKKQTLLWSKRLHLAVKAYQELLHTLTAMDTSSDKGVRESSKIIKSNIFYVPEYRDTILSQLVYYDAMKMSRAYLADLITTAHIFLKMLQQFSENRTLIVGKKAKKRSQAQSKKSKKKEIASSEPAPQLDDLWNDVAPEISAVMREGTIPEVVPFDATLETPIDEQKTDAMKRIQKLLRKKDFEEAVGLLRAARQVWPENDYFGKPDIPEEEEFLALRDIFFAKLGADDDNIAEKSNREAEDDHNEEEMDEEEEEEEGGGEIAFEETNFNYEEFLRRFANVKIVKATTILLEHFEENSDQVNHYVVKMLHRIAWDCKMPGMIFQASIFRIFQQILQSKSSRHKELQKFAMFIIRRFTEVAQKNPKAFMELLFWKSTREATEMVDGYDVQPSNGKVSRAFWSEAEEEELRTLFMEHQTKKYTQDLIDWILENIISDDRTRRGVIKKLKEMNLVVNSKTVRNEVQKRLPKEWSEEEMAELTEIWDRVREDRDPVDAICGALTIKRSKNKIKDKLLEMGLAKDRKELRKKRGKNLDGGVKSSWENQSGSEESENSGDSDDEPARKSDKPVSKVTKKSEKAKKGKKSKKQPSVVYSDAQLLGLLKDVIDKDMKDALEWIKESLEDVIEDRDEESTEGVPLVPLSEESETAMDSPNFQRFLRAIGIEPPADEQETYWRVPASMLVSTIRKRCHLIENALSGNFVSEDTATAEESRSDSSDDNDDEDTDDEVNNDLGSVIKFFKPNSLESNAFFLELPSTQTMNMTIKDVGVLNALKSENSERNSNTSRRKKNLKKIKHTEDAVLKSGIETIDEADENEEKLNSPEKVTEDSVDEFKRSRSQDSESDLPTTKKRRVIASDDDDDSPMEDESPEKVARKPVRRIMSDDEDDDN